MKLRPLTHARVHSCEWSLRRSHLAKTLLATSLLFSLVACGGGGGVGGSTSTETSQSSDSSSGSNNIDDQAVVVDALPANTRAFRFNASDTTNDLVNWSQSWGSGLLAGWNPRHGPTVLNPGLKIGFFGRANGCVDSASDGPTIAATPEQASSLTAMMGMQADSTIGSSWIPSGASTSCDASTQSRQGPSAVYYNPSALTGGFGLYTPIGPETNNDTPFIGAYDSKGVDGSGTNANGLSTFVGFRMPWYAADAVQPWVGSTGSPGLARIVSTQFVGSMQTPTSSGSSTIQVKQQIVVALINRACQQAGSAVKGPCQLQYLFNTAVSRTGVSNWGSYAPAAEGRVWFDNAQSNMPIVAGQVPAAGVEVKDEESGLSLYASAGSTTKHEAFTSRDFDLRVTPAQLQNAVKLVAAKRLGMAIGSLTDAQVASVWGSRWDDVTSWVLVNSMIGQESYNEASASKRAWIGGGFSRMYVGPAL